jgi:hypothetical protein
MTRLPLSPSIHATPAAIAVINGSKTWTAVFDGKYVKQ